MSTYLGGHLSQQHTHSYGSDHTLTNFVALWCFDRYKIDYSDLHSSLSKVGAFWHLRLLNPYLKRFLLMSSALILDSRVVDGRPSFRAAPVGPDTLPLDSVNAPRMISFSYSMILSSSEPVVRWEGFTANHATSIEKVSPSQRIAQ